MGRTKKVFHAVWSGYLLTTINSVANLATYPVALTILGKAQFGLWSAVMVAINFTNIFDLGLGPSLARFITDYKDDRSNPAYAVFLKSVFFIGLIQGTLFIALAVVLVHFLPQIMGIPENQSGLFKTLLYWQMVPSALSFPLRPLAQLLYAHQDIARLNGCNAASVMANTAILLVGLKIGWGIYAYVAAAWAAFLVTQTSLFYFILRLRLLPDFRGARISLKAMKPLAAFSLNVFPTALGTQLINFAPALLVNRQLGLNALADWNFGTRLVLFAGQIVGRVPNASEPAFWEMFARHELSRLRQRLFEVILVTGSAASFLGFAIVAINPSFLRVWTSGRVEWVTTADVCFALWVILSSLSICFNMAAGITKRIGAMKFIYMMEGIVLVALAYAPIHLHAHWMIVLALLGGISLFRLPYGLFRTQRDLEVPGSLLTKTLLRVFGIATTLLAAALTLRFLTSSLSAISQLAIIMPTFGALALPLVFKFGLPPEYQQRIRIAVLKLLGKQPTAYRSPSTSE